MYSVTSEAGGLVNKISMFDKDMMLLVVFGLRGLKHEDEAQKALQCASQLKESLDDVNIINVSIAVTSGSLRLQHFSISILRILYNLPRVRDYFM